MSKVPQISDPSPTDAYSREDRGSLERKRRHAGDEGFSPTSERRDSVRSRPLSWHPSAPVEPPLSSSQHRSIGVTSILNHPATEGLGVRTASVDAGREGLGEQPPLDSQAHSRFSSSSAVHLPSPSSMHPANPPVLSPGMRSHQGIAPVSPSKRFVGSGGYFPPRAVPGQSPLSQQLPGLQTVAPTSPLPTDTSSGHAPPVPGHNHQTSAHSTSTFASHRTNTNLTSTPSPKETSPTTPASVFSQLGRSSPAVSTAPIPQSAPMYMNPSHYAAVDPVTRLPLAIHGQRHSVSETPGVDGSRSQTNISSAHMIECYIDYKSGSSTQAEKRKANSDASRRFRQRKRNDTQKDQKITAQQDEIRKQAETIQKQTDELHVLREQREFYRSERDYFRDQVSQFVPPPARPTSPLHLRPDEANAPQRDPREGRVWTGSGVSMKTEEAVSDLPSQRHPPVPRAPAQHIPPLSGPMPGGNWSAPSAYSAQSERVTPTERQRPMSPMPGTWSRSA
ncbi:uncharacterized protein BDV14DRAFT_203086 [Aspergillus stella-maris]|uniref:uncharacterized protein n=1 Tax=Aspergillus stella-maris TaxID=1810926 RepID=UPI003CCDF0A5